MLRRCINSEVLYSHGRLSTRLRRHTTTTTASTQTTDPFAVVAPHLSSLRTSLLPLLTSGHPALSELTKYYFQHPSKQVRPVLILLFSLATNGLGSDWAHKKWHSETLGAGGREDELDKSLSRPDVLNDWNPDMQRYTRDFRLRFDVHGAQEEGKATEATSRIDLQQETKPVLTHSLLPTQLRLAQIVEMLHTASLLHDDVIDESELRRGAPSAPAAFGNKLSVLGGNFVLGRASAMLARLGDEEVTELIAGVLSNLVEGEILQMREVKVDGEDIQQGASSTAATSSLSSSSALSSVEDLMPSSTQFSPLTRAAWAIYLQKTYLKTASLMAKGARSAVVLGGCKDGEPWKEIAYAYGRNIGIAFQLVDDILDYEHASSTLGKPGGADLQLGLTTGPALYAWEEHPELGELIKRGFEGGGDVEKARNLVLSSSGVERTRALAQEYADQALNVLEMLPDSEGKRGLAGLVERVMRRKN
ncbi:hypothetical protein CVT24_000066 [Panaeolus cyanescens]|uniref:(2E,6E)-farnesyl diphosphate synthase n=1 Tax=Panaeolus cyanescens TaxID=181874 RepID=A0A409VSJ3_9AGAR|nr:hypothetical protein CVT24_000066 [Panaeolus cyanescens]